MLAALACHAEVIARTDVLCARLVEPKHPWKRVVTNKISYQAHTQDRKHQTNLVRRGPVDQNSRINDPSTALPTNLHRPAVEVKKGVRGLK